MSLQNSEKLPRLLEGYLSEEQYADERGVTIRTCQRDRALRQGPPYVILGKKVYYRIEAVREWLLSQEQANDRDLRSNGGRHG